MTQCEKVKQYIEMFGSITPLEAFRDLGIMRLGARIWDLEHAGVEFEHETVEVTNRLGEPCHVTRYRFKKQQTELVLV